MTENIDKLDNYWSQCDGCPEGHSSFWKTVVESPQWEAWETEMSKRLHTESQGLLFDLDESRECGWISQKHFQAFIEFCKTLDVCTWCGGNWINKSCSQCGADIQKQ